MVEFLKFLKGYVRIKVWGFSPERFMNLCSNKNILLWDIKIEGDIYYMSISLRGFYQLKPIVKKTGTRAVILKRCGLPFLLPKVFARKIFIFGLFLCVIFWYISGKFIWSINIEGNYSITDDIFKDFLKNQNVYIGMKKNNLEIESLEKEIRKQFKEVTWTSARVEGTVLSISIKENDAPIIKNEKKDIAGYDLVANFPGKIVSMIVRSGVPLVSIGNEIEKGDSLVLGNVPIVDENGTIINYQYVTADADIMVETKIGYYDDLSFKYQEKCYTGREKNIFMIGIENKEIQIGFTNTGYLSQDIITEKKNIKLFHQIYLPIEYGKKIYREYYLKEKVYSKEEASNILFERCNYFLKTLEEKGVQIIEKNVKIEKDRSRWFLDGTITVISPCGESVPCPIDTLEQELKSNKPDDVNEKME